MTSIKVFPDDRGTQNLRADNLRPQATGPISSTSPIRALHPGKPQHYEPQRKLAQLRPRLRRRLLAERRRGGDRRRTERRRQNRQVMLDTRNYRERRRRAARRRSDSIGRAFHHGVDTEV